jgi:integrative and conjugative element protein (TIGR02256 family)
MMVHWFKRHPNFLQSESDGLSKSKIYNEKIQVRNNLFLSHGNVIVRLDKISRFPFLVVYTEGTPYELPLIYPLKEELNLEFVQQLAAMDILSLQKAIYSYIKFRYELRHQNASGVLCILEWDNLDDGSKFYGIKNILERVKDWCQGLITGIFPPDSQEVEFCSHFNNIDYGLKFFYPEPFLDQKMVEGEAYGLKYTYIPKGRYYPHDRYIYFGCLLTGKNKAGIYESLGITLPNFFFEEGILNALDLVTKPGIIDRLVADKTLIKISWFQIEKEPAPFSSFTELVTIIGNGNFEVGQERMQGICLQGLKLKPDNFLVAIRFPNRKGAHEFQIFKVTKKSSITGILINTNDKELFNYLLDSYDHVDAIECEKFTDESFHQRNKGRADRNRLINAHVNIAGAGALGSEIADCMGKAGVGNLLVIDNQFMKAHNAVRHVAGLDHIGLRKVDALGQVLSNHNPFINIQVYGGSINTIDVNDNFYEHSITISSIAEDNTEGYLNERAVIADKTVYYSRALRGGKAARIFRVIPGKDACFNCLDLYRSEDKEFISIPADPDLPTLKNECNNPIRPASAADLKLISALTSRIILDEIQKGFGDNNHWIWSTETLPGLQPFQLHTQIIPPHSNCCYCHHDHKAKVYINKNTLEFMQQLIAKNPKIETGGVLAGFVDENRNFCIIHASDPGTKAICTPAKFEKDVEYCQNFLDDLFARFEDRAIYLGEWHSHPCSNNRPSNTDLKSLTGISYQKEYLTDRPLMIIFSNTGLPSCTIHPVGKRYYFTKLEIEENR